MFTRSKKGTVIKIKKAMRGNRGKSKYAFARGLLEESLTLISAKKRKENKKERKRKRKRKKKTPSVGECRVET